MNVAACCRVFLKSLEINRSETVDPAAMDGTVQRVPVQPTLSKRTPGIDVGTWVMSTNTLLATSGPLLATFTNASRRRVVLQGGTIVMLVESPRSTQLSAADRFTAATARLFAVCVSRARLLTATLTLHCGWVALATMAGMTNVALAPAASEPIDQTPVAASNVPVLGNAAVPVGIRSSAGSWFVTCTPVASSVPMLLAVIVNWTGCPAAGTTVSTVICSAMSGAAQSRSGTSARNAAAVSAITRT